MTNEQEELAHLDPAVISARDFAIDAHGDQKYGNNPYSFHLDKVTLFVIPFGIKAQQLAQLHDVGEDTTKTYAEIEKLFGDDMARMVDLISDEDGASRKERKAKTHAKLAALDVTNEEHKTVLLVKLADRLANVMASVYAAKNGKLRHLVMYRKEHEAFSQAVYRDGFHTRYQQIIDELLAA